MILHDVTGGVGGGRRLDFFQSSGVSRRMVVNKVASTAQKHKPLVDNVKDHGKLAVRNCETDHPLPFHCRVVWSPIFEDRPPVHGSGNMHGLKRVSSAAKEASDGELPAGWKTAEQGIRKLMPCSSAARVSQEFGEYGKNCASSSDEERSVGASLQLRAEYWTSASGPDMHEDISEDKESSSDSSREFDVRSSRSAGRAAAAISTASSVCSDVTEDSTTKRWNIAIQPGNSSMAGKRNMPFHITSHEGTSSSVVDFRGSKQALASHFTFSSSRSNDRRSSDDSFAGKNDSVCSVGSGGIGRGRVAKSNAGKENEHPAYVKSEDDNQSRSMNLGAFPDMLESKTQKEKAWSSVESSVGETADGHSVKRQGDHRICKPGGKSDDLRPQGVRAAVEGDSWTSVSCGTVTDVEKERSNRHTTMHSRERRSHRRLRRRRSETPADVVACAASMIGDTVEAVRKVRKDAAELAFKIAVLHAHNAKALRSAAAVMCQQIDQLQDEVQEFETTWSTKEASYPWRDFLREFLVTVSVISGVFSFQAFFNFLRRAASDGRLVQTATRKEKMILAAVMLSMGARFGSGMWQGLNQVAASKQARQTKLSQQFNAIAQRVTSLSAASHSDPTVTSLPTDEDGS